MLDNNKESLLKQREDKHISIRKNFLEETFSSKRKIRPTISVYHDDNTDLSMKNTKIEKVNTKPINLYVDR